MTSSPAPPNELDTLINPDHNHSVEIPLKLDRTNVKSAKLTWKKISVILPENPPSLLGKIMKKSGTPSKHIITNGKSYLKDENYKNKIIE